MLISPALLDFLEQAIEPIPVVIPLSGTGVSKGSKNGELWLNDCHYTFAIIWFCSYLLSGHCYMHC